jgi:transcription termination factor Rho
VLPDGFGFLRSPDTSYLAGTDDIYIRRRRSAASTSHTGDTIEGEIRQLEGRRALFRAGQGRQVNSEPPERQNKILSQPDAAL